MRTQLGRYLLLATAGLGLASATTLNAWAAEPNCPYPILPAPGAPVQATPTPSTPPTDSGAGVFDQMPADTGVGASIPADAGATAAATDTGDAGTTSATGTDMIGRSDFFNRFNLFDTQSAVPRTRVWFNFQRNQGFNPALIGNPALPLTTATSDAVLQRPTQYLYRGGFELALSPCLSFAAQHQYIDYADGSSFDASWGDPQFMIKYALSMEHDRVVSATLGFSPHLSQSQGEIRSPRARLYPGMLYWRNLNERLFTQGGFQFGLPMADRGDVPTFDYAVSTGFWVYKACDIVSCRGHGLVGIAPQVEFFGQHAFWDSHVNNSPFTGVTTNILQGRHVVDVTLGTSFVFRHLVIGGGYSFPITGAEARRGEIIGTVILRF